MRLRRALCGCVYVMVVCVVVVVCVVCVCLRRVVLCEKEAERVCVV